MVPMGFQEPINSRRRGFAIAAVCASGIIFLLLAQYAVNMVFNSASHSPHLIDLRLRAAASKTRREAIREKSFEKLVHRVEAVDEQLHRAELNAPSLAALHRFHDLEDRLGDDDIRLRGRLNDAFEAHETGRSSMHRLAFQKGVQATLEREKVFAHHQHRLHHLRRRTEPRRRRAFRRGQRSVAEHV